jgi:hypothetical protein
MLLHWQQVANLLPVQRQQQKLWLVILRLQTCSHGQLTVHLLAMVTAAAGPGQSSSSH